MAEVSGSNRWLTSKGDFTKTTEDAVTPKQKLHIRRLKMFWFQEARQPSTAGDMQNVSKKKSANLLRQHRKLFPAYQTVTQITM